MRSLTAIVIVLFAAIGGLSQSPAAVSQAPDADDAKLRLEAFDKVWNTVNVNHYDPTFGGVDWKKVRSDYLPRAAVAKSDAEFHNVLRKMLGELKLSHFGIYPKNLAAQTAGNAGIGVELRMIAGEPVVTRVDPGTAAEEAGAVPGFVVTKVGGTSVEELLRPLEASIAERAVTDQLKKVYRERTLSAIISGAAGSKVSIEFLDANDRPLVLEIERKIYPGEMSQALGEFPPQPVVFESKRLPGNIGYIRFNMWVIPQMAKIRAALREFADAKGIVIDIRGNPGGVGVMAPGVAGLLMDKQASLGKMKMRSGTVDFVAYPQDSPFLGPIAILIDHGSASTSEVFAAGMQELGRATVIGETSAGAVLPSVFVKLPTGATFQYVVADYRSPKDVFIEGRGVIPDIAVAADRRALLGGRDLQLEAAIKYVTK